MRKITVAAALAFAVPLVAAAPPSPQGARFLADAIRGDNSEVAAGQLAQQRGASRTVRDYGAMLARDHGAHKTKLAAMARSMRLDVPDGVTPEARRESERLMRLRGRVFDRAFAQAMIEGHQKNIGKYEVESRMRRDAELARMARDTLPTLRHHLDMARRL